MADSAPAMRWIEVFRRNERRLAALWLGGVALLFAMLIVGPVRLRVLHAVQLVADLYERRWDRRLESGARLMAAGRFDDAIPYLERLDAEFPARSSRQGRDKEREYLLRQLATAHEKAGHAGKAMRAWERLIAFDSLNYRNHFGYAQAAERLLSGWAMAPEAKEGYAKSLLLFPSHLPSLRGYVKYYDDRSEWREITAAYRVWLDAFVREPILVRLGDSTRAVTVLVDGRAHDVELDIAAPSGWQGSLVIESQSYPISIERVEWSAALTVGEIGPRVPRSLDLSTLTTTRMVASGTAWVPVDSGAAVKLPITAGAGGVAHVTLRLRAFKLMDKDLLAVVRKCYRNLLDWEGLADAEARTAVFDDADAAEQAFTRLEWAAGGQYVKPFTKAER